MTDPQGLINTIALTRINHFHLTGMVQLYRRLDSAAVVIEHRHGIREMLPDASPKLASSLQNVDQYSRRADEGFEWDVSNGVMLLCMNDENYPQRSKECGSAPLVLFHKGSANLNQRRVINVMGARRNTAYSEGLIRRFMTELRQLCPQVLVVSGLAYGVDILTHRHALQNGYPTVGVLAHELDYLCPSRHRQTADRMVRKGGLFAEPLIQANTDKVNSARGSRIVAGVSDTYIIVESAAHDGGLIIADLSRTYNGEVFAFSDSVGSPYSEGCSNLIKNNVAGPINHVYDFARSMGWKDDARLSRTHHEGIERQLFPDLSTEELRVVGMLGKNNNLQVNMLSVQAGTLIAKLSAILFTLEMKNVSKALPGGIYHLLTS